MGKRERGGEEEVEKEPAGVFVRDVEWPRCRSPPAPEKPSGIDFLSRYCLSI